MRESPKEILQKLQMMLAMQDIDFACNPKKYVEAAYKEMVRMRKAIEDAQWALDPMNWESAESVSAEMGIPINFVQDCVDRNRKAKEILDKALA